MDMTDTEKAAMGRHAEYLTTFLQNGSGVAFGPVFDPNGVFGMGIVEAADETAVRAITDKDPAVLAGVGRYEIYPMYLLKKE